MSNTSYQSVDYHPVSGKDLDASFHSIHDVEMVGFSESNPMTRKQRKKSFKTENSATIQSKPTKTLYERVFSRLNFIIFFTSIALLILLTFTRLANHDIAVLHQAKDTNTFDEQGRYIMRDYDLQKPMANFLNGIGGVWGVPMWAFYINRGQGITSFGKQNKDGSIAKFLTAEKAYQQSPYTAFRTLVKGKRPGMKDGFNAMPFYPRDWDQGVETDASYLDISRDMFIGKNEFEIQEVDNTRNLQTNVVYFSLTNEDFPALVRMTTFTNTDSQQALYLEALDGLAKLLPSGLQNGNVDAMGRTMEAWMNVYNVGPADSASSGSDSKTDDEAAATPNAQAKQQHMRHLKGSAPARAYDDDTPGENAGNGDNSGESPATVREGKSLKQSSGYNIVQPFYHISQGTADTAQVQIIKDGHFVLSYVQDAQDSEVDEEGGDASSLYPLLPQIVDPNVVFKYDTALANPSGFFKSDVDTLLAKKQCTTGRTPSAYTALNNIHLAAGESVTVISVYGHANNLDEFVSVISPKLRARGYIAGKRAEANKLVVDITRKVATNTSSAIFNSYVQQNFLDNLLRGGLPVIVGGDHVDSLAADPREHTASDSSSSSRKLSETSSASISDAHSRKGAADQSPPSSQPSAAVLSKSKTATLATSGKRKVFHTFSRIHGDIERDYNNFQIDTSYFSQGSGNFRDVAQNRRSDVFHTPAVADFNVLTFLSFVQADGFNPLTVASTNFRIPAAAVDAVVQAMNLTNAATDAAVVKGIFSKPFRPGQLFSDLKAAGIQFSASREAFLATAVNAATQTAAGQYAQNGFWADHWTYTLDLVDSYLQIYPDNEEALLFRSAPVPFYMSPAYVKPRAQRYSLVNNEKVSGSSTVRVYSAVSSWGDADFSPARMNAMNAIFADPSYVADPFGAGGVWQRNADNSVATVSVFGKLLVLGALKYSTLDSQGMGVEMEGGKPGWNDAMNGLPGLLGSGMPETYEMLRIVKYLIHSLKTYSTEVITVPAEFNTFLAAIAKNLDNYNSALAKDTATDKNIAQHEFDHWNANNIARETYRASVVATFSGATATLDSAALLSTLKKFEAKVNAGIARALATVPPKVISPPGDAVVAFAPNVISPTYFYYECTAYTMLPITAVTVPAQTTQVQVTAFKQHTLPFFLEGPTRHLKVVTTVEGRRAIYQAVKSSAMYDKGLKMYKLSAPLTDVDQEVGRLMAFSPGWLENQSVWLHMSYKFYLELLRGGLYDEFFAEIATGLVPFMDAKRYGRSPLEAASFIVSSEFPDKALQGGSFLARLSGSTAEFLSMWTLMMVGDVPFSVSNSKNELGLKFAPKLPAWLFNADKTLSFTFLGAVKVTYHNPAMLNTWNLTASSVVLRGAHGPKTVVNGAVLNSDLATRVRNLEFSAIDVTF